MSDSQIDVYKKELAKVSLKKDELEKELNNEKMIVKKLQAEIDNLKIQPNNDLEDKIKEIQSQKKQIEKANKAINIFLEKISHELKTPLNGIIGLSEIILKSDIAQPQIKEYSDKIHSSGKDLYKILDEILHYAEIENKEVVADIEEFYCKDFFEKITGDYLELAERKNLIFNKSYIDLDRKIKSDSYKLKIIINILLENAFKFTEKGSIDLVIKFESNKLNIMVKDSGPGIPKDKLSVIFDSFMQADNSTKRKQGGTGLGLTILKKYVEILQGTINTDSVVGVGTTFNISLPAVSEDLVEEKTDGPFSQMYPNKILIVEDNEINQIVIRDLLKTLGYEADIAGNGKIALDLIEVNYYDLVFMDIQMPQMDGIEATKIIRKKYNEKDMNITFLSANINNDFSLKCKEAGGNNILSKPVDFNEIKKILIDNSKIERTHKVEEIPSIEVVENTTEEEVTDNIVGDYDFIDIKYLNRNYGLKMLRDILPVFTSHLDKLLSDINNSIKDGNIESIQKTSHALKGSAANIGAYRIAEVCATLEIYGKDLKKFELRDHFFELVENAKNTKNEIEKILAQ